MFVSIMRTGARGAVTGIGTGRGVRTVGVGVLTVSLLLDAVELSAKPEPPVLVLPLPSGLAAADVAESVLVPELLELDDAVLAVTSLPLPAQLAMLLPPLLLALLELELPLEPL